MARGRRKKAARKGSKNPFKGMTVKARPANRRERAVQPRGPRWLTAALDAVARHRASSEPLDRVLQTVFKASRLGPRDRNQAADAAFAWARRRLDAERAIDEQVERYGGVAPSRREKDAAALALSLRWTGQEVEVPLVPALVDVLEASLPPSSLALPAWLAKELERLDDSPALLAALAEEAPVGLAVDRREVTLEQAQEALRELGAEPTISALSECGLRLKRRVPLGKLPAPVKGQVWPMDEGSQAVVLALEPAEGLKALDLCAGGGGKTRLLESFGVDLVACDVDRARLDAARARSTGGTTFCVADGRSPPFAEETFDRILIDAPCSGTGTLRRAPDLLHRLEKEQVEAWAALQKEILSAALPLLKPGGRLVYATCSLLPRENTGVVEAVAKRLNEGFSLEAQRELRPDREGCDGFYWAAFVRAAA